MQQITDTQHSLSAMAIEHINPKWLKTEPDLYATKWWDYRNMHPTLATLHYAESYKEAKKYALKIRHDLYIGKNHKGLKSHSLFENSPIAIAGIWRGRQHADERGIPYGFYCYSAFKYCETMNRLYLPTPVQMYGSKRWTEHSISMLEYIEKAWASKSHPRPTDAFYKAKNYTGHDYQRQYQLHLIEEINNHPASDFLLSDLIYDSQMLLPDLAAKVFGKKQVERVRAYSDSEDLAVHTAVI